MLTLTRVKSVMIRFLLVVGNMDYCMIWNRRIEQLGSAKVCNLNTKFVRHEQILRLQVAMDVRRGRRVEVVHPVGCVDAETYLLIQGERSLRLLLYD